MIPLPGDMTYRFLVTKDELGALYDKLKEQDLLWLVWPECENVDKASFVAMLMRPEVCVFAAINDANLAGCLLMRPFGEQTLVGEIGVTAFRPYFSMARGMFLNALVYLIKNFDPAPAAFIGKVARVNRHILKMLASCGFREAARLPGLLWHSRTGHFMGGALVIATARDILQVMED